MALPARPDPIPRPRRPRRPRVAPGVGRRTPLRNSGLVLGTKRPAAVRPLNINPAATAQAFVNRPGPATQVRTTSTPGPTAPKGPYDDYPEWARRIFTGIDNDWKNHSTYVGFDPVTGNATGGGVAQWAKDSMGAVNQIAGNYLGQYGQMSNALVSGAYQQAAAYQPGLATGTMPGSLVSSPTSVDYAGRSQQIAAQAIGNSAETAWRQRTGTEQIQAISQGYLNSLADYAKGLPALYAEKRRTAREQIDQFLADQATEQAKLDETNRHNTVTESISALNAKNNLIIGLGNLGVKVDAQTLKALDVTADNNRADAQAAQPSGASGPFPPGTQPPAGYSAVTGADGNVYFFKEPKPASGGGGSGGSGAPRAPVTGTARYFQSKGYTKPGGKPNVGRINRNIYDVGVDNTGQVWVKRRSTQGANGGGSGGSSTTEVVPVTVVAQRLRDAYRSDRGILKRYRTDGERASAVVAWVYTNRNQFRKRNGKLDPVKMRAAVVAAVGTGGVFRQVMTSLGAQFGSWS